MAILPDTLMTAIEAAIAQTIPSFILTSRVIIAVPRRKLEWDGLVMVTRTLHTRQIIEVNEPVWAVKYRGLYYVAEGNHRSRVAQLWGQRRIAARLVKVPEDVELTPRVFFAISMIIGSRQPVPRQLNWVDNVTNVHRILEEAARYVTSTSPMDVSKKVPQKLKVSRISVGKILFGPAFSKLSQDACVDPKRLGIDPLFNHSEAGRVFWSGAVRLIQSGIMDRLDELVKNNFKLQTKHLRLTNRLNKEQMQLAISKSVKDPSFNWADVITEEVTEDTNEPTKFTERHPDERRNRQTRRVQTDAGERTTENRDLRLRRTERVRVRSKKGPIVRQEQASSDAKAATFAATDAKRGTQRPRREETSSQPTAKRAKLRSMSQHEDLGGLQWPPGTRSKEREPATPESPSRETRKQPTADNSATEEGGAVSPDENTALKSVKKPKTKNTATSKKTDGIVRSKRTGSQNEAERVKPTSEECRAIHGPSVSQSEATLDRTASVEVANEEIHPRTLQHTRESEAGCAVIGCKLSPTSGMHKCQTCHADLHTYCCERILRQPLQQDNNDPIYCSKCWTLRENSDAQESAERKESGGSDEVLGRDLGMDERRMEEDLNAVNNVFRNLQQVEGVRLLVGSHDPAITRDFGEIMTLTRRALRLTESVRLRIS